MAEQTPEERAFRQFDSYNKSIDARIRAQLMPRYLAVPNPLEARAICREVVRESQPRFVPIGDDNG